MNTHLMLLCLFLITPFQEQAEEKDLLKIYSAEEIGLSLPEAWTVRSGDEEMAVLDLNLVVPLEGRNFYGRLSVYRIGSLQLPRAQPWMERAIQLKRYRGDRAEVGLTPLPHLEILYTYRSKPQKVLIIYRVVKGRGFSITASIEAAAMSGAAPALFRAAESLFNKTQEPWPPVPEGYTEKERNGYLYLKHPAFKGTIGAVHTRIIQEAKGFSKIHGSIAMDEDWPPVILLHGKDTDFTHLLPPYAPRSPEAWCHWEDKRLFCHHIPKKKSLQMGAFARELNKFLHTLRYGNLMPHWLCLGESEIAYDEGVSGKKLPHVPKKRYTALPKKPRPFKEVIHELKEKDFLSFTQHSFIYCTLFRLGDKRYRIAFNAFLKAFQENGDFEGAAEKHLLSLDQEVMAADAALMIKKSLKPGKAAGKVHELN